MLKTLRNLTPILVVVLMMVIGFTMLHRIEASPSENNDECADLWTICAQEANYAAATCNAEGSDSHWCQEAEADAEAACANAANCQ